MMNFTKKFFASTLFSLATLLPALAVGAEGGHPLDRAPDRSTNMAALQNGAKLFVNYCLNCHNASSMRYNRLRDIGLSEDQIRNNLLFTGEKVGELMTTAMPAKDAKAWFGVVPPDLSVISRAKSGPGGSGGDYLYTYLRTFYKDDTRPTGFNNLVIPNVAMPHVLWQLQGVQAAKWVDEKDPHDATKTIHKFAGFQQVTPGTMSQLEFDTAVADLVGYMEWMAEPAAQTRKRLGVAVLLFLSVFAFLAWRLNAAYWKEVK
ncbi:ubiquinol-cytochrome c reductase cytochrome c1 subunit [Massilia umbonata]|uniref:Ubiquinol-cytochrome c reductase cytochrome c1 subunit n=2 Tax=Pseudoduganella umbonata TaxID=864828 RepID=A0A7W5EFB8_9BURK|nr:ubiquinol-cytochrome c reductase cytochrome c1 subunit [Pseudoduganella umbonata]